MSSKNRPNRIGALLPVAMVVAALLSVGASTSAFAELKIAVINTQRAITESEEAKKMIEKIRAELERERSVVRKLGEEIQGIQERLQKDGDTLSNSERRRMTKDIEDKQIDFQFQANKLQKAVNDKQQEIFVALGPKVDAVLQDLLEREKYDMILERSSMLYVRAKHDITKKVTERLNRKR